MTTADKAIGNLPGRWYHANSYVNTYWQSILEAPPSKVGANNLKLAYDINQFEIHEQEELRTQTDILESINREWISKHYDYI